MDNNAAAAPDHNSNNDNHGNIPFELLKGELNAEPYFDFFHLAEMKDATAQGRFFDFDNWRIRKILRQDDFEELELSDQEVRKYFFAHASVEMIKECESEFGCRVNVLDWRSGREFVLRLKRISRNSFALNSDAWKRDFVYRLGLAAKDEVLFGWDILKERLNFIVLKQGGMLLPL